MTQNVSTGDFVDDLYLAQVIGSLGIEDGDALILNELKIEKGDALVVTDGSGSNWKHACGWAAIVVDLRTNDRRILQGAMTNGTCYMAELIPYVHALSWYVDGPGHALLTKKLQVRTSGRVDIHAITDNETIAKQGQAILSRKTGNYYWAMIESIRDRGYNLHWHWLRRDRLSFNKECDRLAGLCRESISAVKDLPSGRRNKK